MRTLKLMTAASVMCLLTILTILIATTPEPGLLHVAWAWLQ